MMVEPVKILCTAQINDAFIELASKAGVQLVVEPFIETIPFSEKLVVPMVQNLLTQRIAVVFTSSVAVNALIAAIKNVEKPDWEIFCTNGPTLKLIEDFFGKESIKSSSPNAGLLSKTIIHWFAENGRPPLIRFFCGKHSRKELTQGLKNAGFEVEPYFVYETRQLFKKLGINFEGILFFSPSAVDAFFENNEVDTGTKLFAIGPTTESAIRSYGSFKIEVAIKPSKAGIVEHAIQYFKKNGQP